MPSSSCRFCRHANPPGAKFCNECGSPLHLRPCPRCEAVTDASAGTCHQCGTAFEVDEAPSIVAATAHASATNDALDAPDPHRDRTPAPPQDSAARRRTSVRGDEDEDAPASSELTRIAEPEASTHIPEWLAERFDAANRAGIPRGRTPIAQNGPNASTGAGGERREEAPSRPLLAEYDAHRPRRSMLPLLAIAAVAVLGAGAYYAWFGAAGSISPTTPAPAAPAPVAIPAPPVAHGVELPAPVSPPPSVAAPAEPLASTPPRAPRVQADRGSGATAALNPQSRRGTSDAERSMNRTTQRDRDADETRRLIERDLGRFMTRPPGRSAQ